MVTPCRDRNGGVLPSFFPRNTGESAILVAVVWAVDVVLGVGVGGTDFLSNVEAKQLILGGN
jgi:hypothetical protein